MTDEAERPACRGDWGDRVTTVEPQIEATYTDATAPVGGVFTGTAEVRQL
ncbi:hypothetical protein ACWD8I_09650 [Micromonospora arida]